MVQNFFSEVSFLDMTTDGRFFLCQSKTKQKECYTETVPLFTRGEHPVVGVGFNYENLMNLSDVQLPYMLQAKNTPKKKNLKHYLREISILDHNGVSRSTIAEMLDVSRRSIYNLFET